MRMRTKDLILPSIERRRKVSLKQGDKETHLLICLTVPAAPLVAMPVSWVTAIGWSAKSVDSTASAEKDAAAPSLASRLSPPSLTRC